MQNNVIKEKFYTHQLCTMSYRYREAKKLIPDFTPEQLIGYELRVTNPQHESNIPETTVSAEELGYIMTFLNYKRRVVCVSDFKIKIYSSFSVSFSFREQHPLFLQVPSPSFQLELFRFIDWFYFRFQKGK